MINSVRIQNFKSLADLSLDLSNLNVITGINGMGKSSLIQVLLLLRQAYVPNGFGRGIPLKGPLTGNLGTFADVLSRNAPEDKITFQLALQSHDYSWQFEKGPIDDLLTGMAPKIASKEIALFSDAKFQYIGAGRITPSSSFSKLGEALVYKQFGSSGEFAVQYLYERGTEEFALFPEIFLKEKPGEMIPLPLINQVNYWLNFISPNVSLDIRPISNTEYELRYQFWNGKGFATHSAVNSAFGLTFALPIITAILAAKKGDLLILENPESDLHPRAQSIIGQLIAKAAAHDVQIIVETHSDHILNGICVAVHNKMLSNDLAKIYYFHKEAQQYSSERYRIGIDASGRLDDKELKEKKISGFFDQINDDLETILFSSPS